MIKFISNPNLPQNKVKTVICGSHDEKIINFFNKNNIEVVFTSPNNNIDFSVSQHADMAALHLGDEKIITDKNQCELYESLAKSGMKVFVTENEIKGSYPDDVALNFAVFGDSAVGNFNYADAKLGDFLKNRKLINVKQGYSKCSILVVNENSVITDDLSIHRKLTENGIESLLISKGDIFLAGHEYGFIGGASGKISKDTIVFFGDIRKHRDFDEIQKFIFKHGCKYVCTDTDNIRDIGGIIPISEL